MPLATSDLAVQGNAPYSASRLGCSFTVAATAACVGSDQMLIATWTQICPSHFKSNEWEYRDCFEG